MIRMPLLSTWGLARRRRLLAPSRPSAARLAALPFLALLTLAVLWPAPARAQLNFKPLDRGDVKEVEQHLVVVHGADGKEFGLELGGEFALRLRDEKATSLANLDSRTQFDEDFRLKIRTWFHQDVALHLTLQTTPSGIDDANLRGVPAENRGTLTDGRALTLTAREAYLLYNPNPNSHLIFGKHELSMGDRRGKVYDAIMPGATFDCRAGTWCMPFGAVRSGEGSADWIYHWALDYRAWDDRRQNLRDTLEVEIFRIIYTEQNVPLGKNLGPGRFNRNCADAANSTTGCKLDPSQMTDADPTPNAARHAIYYDANQQEYFGLRANWLTGPLFVNFDYDTDQGQRRYHRYRKPDGGIEGPPTYAGGPGSKRAREAISGYTWETELGFRWQQGQTGLRYMTASGDAQRGSENGESYLRVLQGYHEITPGSYRGTRLYFNGVDSDVELGGGLGHSVNNTTLVGVYVDLDYPDDVKVGYSGGLFQIRKNRAILNVNGKPQGNVGVELDNVLTWHVHKALKVQFEANLLRPDGAFSLDDFTPPDLKQSLFVQGIVRLVYRF